MSSLTPERWRLIERGAPFRLHFDSLEKALDLAKKLQTKGYVFRGQTNAKWLVTSSATRLNAAEFQEAQQKMGRFVNWARSMPQMNSVSSDIDSLLAIGQHYGLATLFIDFTDDPEIAAFFACDTTREVPPGQNAAIICLNVSAFEKFWRDYGPHLLANTRGAKPPEIVRIDVQNLWRLQSQKGCFVWNPIANIEDHYDFDRITFPYTKDHPALPARERIYPKNQSALEQLLTAFFMDEQMRTGNQLIETMRGLHKLELTVDANSYDVTSWYPDDIETTEDWKDADEWQRVPSELAEDTLAIAPLDLHEPNDVKTAAEELLGHLTIEYIAKNRSRGLLFPARDVASTPVLSRLDACVRRLWNGMRRLPFTDTEVRQALEQTIPLFLSAKRDYRGAAMELAYDAFESDRIYTEFSRNPEGKGDYSRAYVSGEELRRAHNPEFVRIASNYLGDPAPAPVLLLQVLARPWQRFSFAGLRRLMVRELIPSQLVLRGDDPGDSALMTVIYFSPADLQIFGLA